MYDKLVQIALLFDFYGQLLTDKQIEIVDMYYNNDLSLGEISEQQAISRQGVYDTLKRAEKTLFEYEEKLGLVERHLRQQESLKKTMEMLNELLTDDSLSKNAIKEKLLHIKSNMYDII